MCPHIVGCQLQRNPPVFSTKVLHWAVNNHITHTPCEHRPMSTRSGTFAPLDPCDYNTHTQVYISGDALVRTCFPFESPRSVPFHLNAKWKGWLFLDLCLLLRCFPDAPLGHDCLIPVAVTGDLSSVSTCLWVCLPRH